MKLSVIIPYVNEWPQVAFTLREVANQLSSLPEGSWEVIAVDNWCSQVEQQMAIKEPVHKVVERADGRVTESTSYVTTGRKPDKGHDRKDSEGKEHRSAIWSWARKNDWLKYETYTSKLSHWNAKMVGVRASTGDVLLFLDAHVMPGPHALRQQLAAFDMYRALHGPHITLHLPLTYHILENHKLIYRLVDDRDNGNVAYTFSGCPPERAPFEVPCMSCCGVMMARDTLEHLGGWPKLLGIYSGGEHFINFVGAVVGLRKFVVPDVVLHHYGAQRGYNYEYTDAMRNRGIANYLFGDEEYLDRWLTYKKGNEEVKAKVRETILHACKEQRELIKSRQVCSIDEWLDKQVKHEA